MRLTLCLPGSLLPRQAFLDTISGLELPALSLLIGRGSRRRSPPAAYYASLAQLWNIAAPPLAALRLLGEGGAPAAADWLCLDPVHLQVHRRGVKLADPAGLALTGDEDAALRATLAPVFTDVGTLIAATPGHWHLRLHAACGLITTALPDAAGQAVDPALPGGHDGARWRLRLAEAQTLLGGHEINRTREAAGQPVVNSLWPWGPGRLTAPPAARCDMLWSNDAVVRGLGLAAGIAVGTPPARFEAAGGNDVLAVLDELAAPARNFDALAWREAWTRLERDWFAPALAALRRGHCAAVHLAASGPDASLAIGIARADLLKLWRRPLPPARLAA